MDRVFRSKGRGPMAPLLLATDMRGVMSQTAFQAYVAKDLPCVSGSLGDRQVQPAITFLRARSGGN